MPEFDEREATKLSPDEVIELKGKLMNGFVASEVCRYMVEEIVADQFTSGDEPSTGWLISLAAGWGHSLARAVSLPGDEWPIGSVPPEDYSEALRVLDEQKLAGQGAMRG